MEEKNTLTPEEKPEEVKEEKKKKKKKRFPVWLRVLLSVIAVILAGSIVIAGLLGGGAYVFINNQLSKLERPDEGDDTIETVAPEDEFFEENEYQEGLEIKDPEDIQWAGDVNTLHAEGVTNILLIGQDTRVEGAIGRSDSMMILTINTVQKTLKVTSLMRDMYVQIPGYSDNRINAAYFFGGYELLQRTIELNLGVKIDYYAEIDFFAFVKIIDILDGIYINLNAQEAEYLKALGHRTVEGRNRLDGEAALSYCQVRAIGNSDYERTERQRKTIASIYDRLKGTVTVPMILDLVDEIFPLIRTNMTNGQIMSLAMTVFTMNASGVQSYRIPANGTFTPMFVRGMAVLVPDLAACRSYLREILYGN